MHFSADAERMIEPGHEVLEILAQERQVLEELTHLAAQVRNALISCDVLTLETLANRQEALIQSLLMLDASRQELVEQQLEQRRRPRGGEVPNGREEEHLLAAYEGVRTQAKTLQTANAINQRLLAGIARWTKELLDALADLLTETASYDRYGLQPVRLESNLLMDRRV